MLSFPVCPHGHRWDASAPAVSDQPLPAACPVCGSALVAPGELPTVPPRVERSQAAAGGTAAVPEFIDGYGIEGYEILGELGRGGMGVVYKARQVGLKRLVALKMILAGSHAGAEERARFRLEAEAAARLQHPNIVPIFEVGEHEGRSFFSMELVDCGSLADQLGSGPWRSRRAAELLATLAAAVQHAHERGIIHRDLKPANILLAADGTPKISDFGLAKCLDKAVDQRVPLTQDFSLLGTPSYMAPEQAEGTPPVSPATDVYALGALLYHLLTGRPPFLAETSFDTVLRLLEDEPIPPRLLNARVARDLQAICLKCLEKDPHCRYASARELGDDLRRYLAGEPTEAATVGPARRLARWARRRPALMTTFLALLVFYTNHLLLLLLGAPGEGGFYHWFVTGLMLSWGLGAATFQELARRPGRQSLATFGWSALDVLLFTALLLARDGPSSPLLPGYHLLIAVTALRFRPRLVWFVTEMCLFSYAVLVVRAHWQRSGQAEVSPQVPIVFALSLLLLGLVLQLLLRRLRGALSGQRSPADVSAE